MNSWGRIGAALALAAAVSLPARAQIPWLQGFGDQKGPSLRLVGTDPLVESAQQLGARIEQRAAEREEVLETLRSELAATRQDLEMALTVARQAAEGSAPPSSDSSEAADAEAPTATGPVAAADEKKVAELEQRLERLASLESALTTERGYLLQAQDVVRSALATARTEVRPTVGERGMAGVLVLKRAVRLAAEQAEMASEAAEADASLLNTEPEPRPAIEDLERLQAWEDRAASVAQTLLARARALELAARERVLEARLEAQLQGLRARPEELESARAAVEEAESKLAAVATEVGKEQALSAKVRGSRHPGLRAQLSRDEERGSNLRLLEAEAVLLRERARLDVLRFLRRVDQDTVPSALAATPFTARLASLRSQKAELLEAKADHLARPGLAEAAGEQRDLLELHAEVLDASLAMVASAEGDLQTALDLVEIAAGLAELRSRSQPVWVAWLLTGLVALFTLLLLRSGHRLLLAWELPARWLAAQLHLGARGRLRAGLALSLFYTVVVASLGLWVILRLVWGFQIDVASVSGAVSHPLFVIDERPVHLGSILSLIVAIVASVFVSRGVRRFFGERVYPMLDWDTGLTTALNTLFHYAMLVGGFLLGLHFVGIGLSSLALFAGVLGIGIGFGMRNVAENFISGLIILAERPIKIGDFIELEGLYEGKVEDIEARATTVVTRDNVSVIIPNSEFIGSRVTNWSYGDPRVRLRVNVGVAYGSDIDLVRRVLLEVAARHGKILKRPQPEVWFHDFGSSSLDFQLLFWIDDQSSRFRIASDLRFAIDKAFRKYAIEIAFPQLDLHVKEVPRVAEPEGSPPAEASGEPEG